jgi:dTDP-4-dehydrorhamnose reductase
MQTNPQLSAARQAVYDALEAGYETTLEAFADFAATEIDSKHIAKLMLSLLQPGPRSRITDIIGSVEVVRHELERQRAGFIEYAAAVMVKEAEQAIAQQQDMHAELDAAQ